MAEMPRQLSQAEIDRILFQQKMNMQPQSIQNLNPNVSGSVTPIPQNLFQRMGIGAKAAGDYVNRAGTAADIAKLFPGYTGQSQVSIPTGFNFAPKQAPTGEIIPGGLQTNQVNVNQLLSAIKPADVLGLTGAQQAYTDVGMGRAPKPMDVVDTLALGAGGMAAGKGLLGAAKGLKNAPVGLSVQDAPGLLQAAPKSDIGFYSAVEQAAMASPRKSATGQAFLNDIMKGPDVRADEIKWMGLDDYLKGKQNVTKQEVQDYIANNRVDVQEVRSTIPRLPGEEMPGDKGAFLPKFGQYTLPGGENYRELLLTMPAKQLTEAEAKSLSSAKDRYIELTDLRRPLSADERFEWDTLAKQIEKENSSYRSSHFDQPNILAHLRVNDRVDADGKKMLLIEEVQSDWHQAGREKGYAGQGNSYQELEKELSNVNRERSKLLQYAADLPDSKMNEFKQVNQKIKELSEKAINIDRQMVERSQLGESVPDAPFKDTWYQLALKRAIQHAAENGYDRIGLTTGSQQAARFDLSKQLSGVSYNTEFKRIAGFDKSGNPVVYQADVEPDQIANYIGKEAAKKLLEQPLQNKEYELRGVDLQVGGEGMKKYYDEIYPKFLDKYGKKWGARVGETKIRTQSDKQAQEDLDLLEQLGEDRSKFSGSGMAKVRYIDITPEMKAGVSKGQPLFQAAPIIGTGLLGSQQEER